MKIVEHRDLNGRLFAVQLPDWEPESASEMGIRLGPPDLSPLDLPLHIEVRLNNELYRRGIITARDGKTRRGEVVAALQSAMKVDAEVIWALYGDGKPS